MATVSTRHCCNQSANICKSCVKVRKDRTDSTSRSAGTATKISVAPISIPPALGLIIGRLRSIFRFVLFFFAMGSPPLCDYGNEPGMHHGQSLKRDHRNIKHSHASPMLLRMDLGSNSLTGSLQQAPLGSRPTLTIAVHTS